MSRFILTLCAMSLALPVYAFAADAPGQPLHRLKAADVRKAKSAVIRKSDLNANFGYRADSDSEPGIPQCEGYPGNRSKITITGSARSGFRNAVSKIGSTVLVFKRVSDQEAYWKATARAAFAACEAKTFTEGRHDGITAKTLSAGPIRMGPTGANRVAAFRIVTLLTTTDGHSQELHETVVFASMGRGVTITQVLSSEHACECYTDLAGLTVRRLRDALH